MKIAIAVFTFFPFGGLTKDLINIARICQRRGHTVRVFAESLRGECPADIDLQIIPVQAMSNHAMNRRFAKTLQQHCDAFNADVLVGFNKMPGLDVYYAADGCFTEKSRQRGLLYRLMPRSRHFEAFEKAVFGSKAGVEILMIAERQIAIYQQFYQTPRQRFHLLPPGISRDRIAPPDARQRRHALRRQWQFADTDKMLLMVGSGFRTKGLDRAITALAALPDELRQRSRLLVIGHDNAQPFIEQARREGVAGQLEFLDGRDDVPDFLLAADVLVHPAYRENTGTVLLEAMVSGLPVITTDICGYAHYVTEQGMGEVISSPFSQQAFNAALLDYLQAQNTGEWYEKGKHFAQTADIYDMATHAVEIIEKVAQRKN